MRAAAVSSLLSIFLLAALAMPVLAGGRYVPNAATKGQSKGVVVLACDAGDVGAGEPIPVSAVSATPGAPDIDADPFGGGDECAEALGRLLASRFKIADVSATADGVVYTLTR
jgi:hypothetical protein